jgi:hypothetical protein
VPQDTRRQIQALFELPQDFAYCIGIEPKVKIFPDVDKLHSPRSVKEKGRGVRHTLLNALRVLFENSELPNQPALGVGQEEDLLRQAEFVNKDTTPLVDLRIGHDPHDLKIRNPSKCFSQLHEPRLGKGSPVHAALEGDQHPVTEQVFPRVGPAIEADQFEFRNGSPHP